MNKTNIHQRKHYMHNMWPKLQCHTQTISCPSRIFHSTQWWCNPMILHSKATRTHAKKNYKMSRFPHPQLQYNDVMSQDVTWSWNGFRTSCWQCCCSSAFFRPGKRHSTLWSTSGDWEFSCSEEKHFTERQVTCRASDADVTDNKDGIFLYVLNMWIAVFAFLREIMSLFDMKDARKWPHWWVSALLCYKSTNALWYSNSLLIRSGAL